MLHLKWKHQSPKTFFHTRTFLDVSKSFFTRIPVEVSGLDTGNGYDILVRTEKPRFN